MIGSKGDLRSHGSWEQGCTGGFPERSKGSDCKSDGIAFAGSNPAPPIEPCAKAHATNALKQAGDGHGPSLGNWYKTISKGLGTGERSKGNQRIICFVDHVRFGARFYLCGCSSMVEPQPSKLKTRVRFPSPALTCLITG